jgi:Tfp pilus assembly protein PilX
MSTMRRDDGGSILIFAVIAMLILGVLGMSLALLAQVETSIGVNYKQQAQAEALAEAGLDRARDLVRSAGDEGGTGFTKWFDGTNAAHVLPFNGTVLGAGQYWARIDNDCPSAFTGTPVFPAYLREGASCDNTTDTNEKAVITAWGVAGTGRVRVRAIVGVDSPWKHVCADAIPDHGGYCNDTANTKGNPTVNPADPNDPNGPRAYADLPRPIIGCSRIDPAVHRSVGYCTGAAAPKLYSQPGVPGYSAYPALATAPQLVIMGEDPAITAGAKFCGQDGSGVKYFGYFDCALRTPCPAGVHDDCPRKACIRGSIDPVTGAPADSTKYFRLGTGPNTDGTTCGINTGMVFKGTTDFNNIGRPTTAYTVYVMHDNAAPSAGNVPTAQTKAITIYGTLVVEGKAEDTNKTVLCTGGPPPSPIPPNFSPPCPTGGTYGTAYGYPMALLTYDPKLAPPTVNPYLPQPIETTFGRPDTVINGIVYSGGTVEFNPINVNGSVVAFNAGGVSAGLVLVQPRCVPPEVLRDV